MTISIDKLHKEILKLKKDINYIKNTLKEEFELSKNARQTLDEARSTPESDFVNL